MPITEARREYLKQYRQDNKEKLKQWRIDNKDMIAKHNKKYRENNKDKIKEWCQNNKQYFKTPSVVKSNIIYKWKTRGLICEDYDSLYCHYLNATQCDACSCLFGTYGDGSGTHKCMDHNHETGAFRNFLCCACNLRRG